MPDFWVVAGVAVVTDAAMTICVILFYEYYSDSKSLCSQTSLTACNSTFPVCRFHRGKPYVVAIGRYWLAHQFDSLCLSLIRICVIVFLMARPLRLSLGALLDTLHVLMFAYPSVKLLLIAETDLHAGSFIPVFVWNLVSPLLSWSLCQYIRRIKVKDKQPQREQDAGSLDVKSLPEMVPQHSLLGSATRPSSPVRRTGCGGLVGVLSPLVTTRSESLEFLLSGEPRVIRSPAKTDDSLSNNKDLPSHTDDEKVNLEKCETAEHQPHVLVKGFSWFEKWGRKESLWHLENDQPLAAATGDKSSDSSCLRLIVRLLSYNCKEWRWYLVALVFLIGYAAARIFAPVYVGMAVSDVIVVHSQRKLNQAVLVMVAIMLVNVFCNGIREGIVMYANARVEYVRIRCSFFELIVEQDIAFFDEVTTGEILSRLTSDTQAMAELAATNANLLLAYFVILVGTLYMMAQLSWQLLVANAVVFPVMFQLDSAFGAYYERLSTAVQSLLADANGTSQDVLTNIVTVKAYGAERFEKNEYGRKLDCVLGLRVKLARALAAFFLFNELTGNILILAVVGYGGHLVATGKLPSSDLIGFMFCETQMAEAVMTLGSVLAGFMQAVGASRKVFEYMDRVPLCRPRNYIPHDGVCHGQVTFEDVSFAYPTRPEVQVLESISLTLNPGQWLSLSGSSGAGKSTILALLRRLYPQSTGRILLDGRDVWEYEEMWLRSNLAAVDQTAVLLGDTVREHLIYGCEDNPPSEEEIHSILKTTAADSFVADLPDGIDSLLARKTDLSGGEQQRLALARSLAVRPKVLLLDEATSALDRETESKVMQGLKTWALNHGVTVIFAAHRNGESREDDTDGREVHLMVEGGRVVSS